MTAQRPIVHQYHAGSAPGDGITNGLFYARRLLRAMGYVSEIYCEQVAPELAGEIHPLSALRAEPQMVLLVHHSLGHENMGFLERLGVPMVMVYHNITPPEFLSGRLRELAVQGRTQLAGWAGRFVAAVGDSAYNAEELVAAGYEGASELPLLLDFDRLGTGRPDPDRLARWRAAGTTNLLFVGRIVRNKAQADLVRVLARLVQRRPGPHRLLLVGGVSDPAYEREIRQLVSARGLEARVEITGKLDDPGLAAAYAAADLYVSVSEHEGFGMPLIEAAHHDVPVLAYGAGSIPGTLGEGGLVLSEKDPDAVAAAAALVLDDPALRRAVLAGQRANLARFSTDRVAGDLAALMTRIGHPPPTSPEAAGLRAPAMGEVDLRLEGPLAGSYSLAKVNRALAGALEQAGWKVALKGHDGGRDLAVTPAELGPEPCWSQMLGAAEAPARIVARNCYPPDTADMRGTFRALFNYAWEESGFPAHHVARFNSDLSLITVTSRYVAKVLRDNGVAVPIVVVGNGVDDAPESSEDNALPAELAGLDPRSFAFLHISSGFPRKGVDVLLHAWAGAFAPDARVVLILKTFPNEHNHTARQLAALAPCAPIIAIDRDLDAAGIAALYARAQAFVAPARGEGFGLPAAEAMAREVPVVATDQGGHRDFLDATTGWPVAWRHAPSASHLALPGSLWAEPDTHDLIRQLRAVHAASESERRQRSEAARARIGLWRWDRAAARTQAAVAALEHAPVPQAPLRFAHVTSWNVRCGIADYAHALTRRIPASQMHIFADVVSETLSPEDAPAPNAPAPDPAEPALTRCWQQGWQDDLLGLEQALLACEADIVLIQFNFGFFELRAFARLLRTLHEAGRVVIVAFHATADVERPDLHLSLRTIADALALADRLLVHGVDDMNRLKAFGLVDNVTLWPHGTPILAERSVEPREAGAFRLASFGFLLPHKGLEELVDAVGILRASWPGLQLDMLHALYPAEASQAAASALRARIAASPAASAITLVTDFLPQEAALARLGQADLVVYPYQETQESSSAAVRFGLGAQVPVAVTPLAIFDELGPVVHRLPGTTPQEMAAGIERLIEDREALQATSGDQAAWLARHHWSVISDRLVNMATGLCRDRALAKAPGLKEGDGKRAIEVAA